MKKKLLLASIAVLTTAGAFAQYSINSYSCVTTGITEVSPVDVEYNPFNQQYNSLHSNSTGMSVVNYDAATGNYLSSVNLYRSASSFAPVKILHDGTYTYVLFNYNVSGTNRFGICKYDNSSNALQWARFLNSPSGSIDETPADMTKDASGNLYVIGSFTSTGGDQDIFIAAINSSGTPLWHKQYANSGYDEYPNNIQYDAGSNDFTVGGTAIGVGNWLDRNVLIWRVDIAGTVYNNTLLSYSTSGPRINGACAKKNGKSVYITATSIIGADGPGPLLIAKLNASSLALVTSNTYFGPSYFNPEFNFTSNNTQLVLSGSASFVNTLSPGMVNTVFNLSTCTFASESRYNTLTSYAWGGPMYNCYNNTLNELGTVVGDPSASSAFYFIKSNSVGFTSCDINSAYSLSPLPLTGISVLYTESYLDITFPGLKKFSIQAIAHRPSTVCYYNPCPGCQSSEYQGPKSMLNDATYELSLYPNPATEVLNIETGNPAVTVSKVELFDMSGRLIEIKQRNENDRVELALGALQNGMYLVKISLSDGNTVVKRFAKN